jgi:hypothetical protein
MTVIFGVKKTKRRRAPAWLSLAKHVYDSLKSHYGHLGRGAWSEVASWASKFYKYGGSVEDLKAHFDPAAVDPENIYRSIMERYPPRYDPDYVDVLEQRLAMGEDPQALAYEVLRDYRSKKISKTQYSAARRLLRKHGFDWSEIDRKRKSRAARRARERDALETVRGRRAVELFFAAEPVQKSSKSESIWPLRTIRAPGWWAWWSRRYVRYVKVPPPAPGEEVVWPLRPDKRRRRKRRVLAPV